MNAYHYEGGGDVVDVSIASVFQEATISVSVLAEGHDEEQVAWLPLNVAREIAWYVLGISEGRAS